MPSLEHADLVPTYLYGLGVEIGAFTTPIPGISPIYVDRFGHYAGAPSGAEFYGDACDLPVHDSSLDFVASSHLIEHVANPIAAFNEWYRVLKDGGIIYMVVPDRRRTFDHPRPLTSVEHMVEDFARGTTQVDGTHIDDFVFGVDWRLFAPGTPAAEVHAARQRQANAYREAIAQGNEINIHFHTFEPPQMQELITRVNTLDGALARMEVVRVEEPFSRSRPDGFLVILRVLKPGTPRSQRPLPGTPLVHRTSALRPDARRF
jgi:SAM-dependent methyltransferase